MPGDEHDKNERKINPVIVKNVTEDMIIMQKEIFGPYLPIMSYSNINEVIDYINRHERPLALYIYSNKRKLRNKIIQNTISGGVTINDCTMHVASTICPLGELATVVWGSITHTKDSLKCQS